MKSFVIYGSFKKLTNAHKLVSNRFQPEYYVRINTMEGDCIQALDKAKKPMEGEILLNTHSDGEIVWPQITKNFQPIKTS